MEPTHDYVARERGCDCCVGLVADLANDFTAEMVARFIREGLTIERISREDLQAIMDEPTFMNCPHQVPADIQLSLFG